ncbi:MAG: primosomal protein N', partial [Planctomycetota bacterium]
VIHAEGGLFLPDFRAGERCFQLLAQVSGRAGRGEKEGVVLVQTMCPDAQPIARAVEMDYEGFAAAELGARSALDYPPSGKLARVVFESRDRALAERRAREVAGQLRSEPGESGLAVLGPAPAPLARVRQRHRFHLVLKFPCHSDFDAFRGKLLALEGSRDRRLRILVDVDPYSML